MPERQPRISISEYRVDSLGSQSRRHHGRHASMEYLCRCGHSPRRRRALLGAADHRRDLRRRVDRSGHGGRPADKAFSYLYANLSTPSPVNAHCATWDPLCRSTIHYPDATADGNVSHQIQPLWNVSRPSTVPADPNPDHKCVLCHNPLNAAGNAQQVPAVSSI